MNTHPDGRFRIGANSLVPYDPTLTIHERHARRTRAALEAEPIIRAWCEARGIDMMVCTNPTDHPHATYFKFRVLLHKDAAVAGWLPGLARAWSATTCQLPPRNTPWRRRLFRNRFERAHLHDWHHLLSFLERWYDRVRVLEGRHEKQQPAPALD